MTSALLACGPLIWTFATVTRVAPPFGAEYARGQLGVIKPEYRSRYLVEAYRVLNGLPPLAMVSPATPAANDALLPPALEWIRAIRTLSGEPPRSASDYYRDSPRTTRLIEATYQEWENCLDDAFVTATRTLEARTRSWGRDSADLREWISGQLIVFENCAGKDLRLPASLPASAPALLRADRDYQIAAAYFYAMDYDEARRRFLSIAEDTASPWRSYGRYLAARANLREATLARTERREFDADRLSAAARELQEVADDSTLPALHASAHGLLDFIADRLAPRERLLALTQRLSSERDSTEQDLVDFAYLQGQADGLRGEPLLDWLLTFRGEEYAHALERWRATSSPAWLVPALWWAPASVDDDTRAIQRAAALLPPSSPAYPTVAVLRVRLLMLSGQNDEARVVLSQLPTATSPGFDAETLNIVRGMRAALALTLPAFLANATRVAINAGDGETAPVTTTAAGANAGEASTVFDEDVGIALSQYTPLARLVDIALSPTLPDRLRARIAVAALARAVALERTSDLQRLAPTIRRLVPAVAADLSRYLTAIDAAERHRHAVILLLRFPTLEPDVQGNDDEFSIKGPTPVRLFDASFRRSYWWCGFSGRTEPPSTGRNSTLTRLLYRERPVPAPAFLTASDRASADSERQALARLGDAKVYLAREAVAWARARPDEDVAAEALSRVVNGWRHSCGREEDARYSQEAFQTLHRLFPKSTWAAQTRYWYR